MLQPSSCASPLASLQGELCDDTQGVQFRSVVSLFAGCGGLDLGFARAGFMPVWTNELSSDAADSYENLLGHQVRRGNIWQLLDEVPAGSDVLVGGPPCQAFSLVGKRLADDPRASLVWAFVQAVKVSRPRAFVMENVTGIAASKIDGRPLPEALSDNFGQLGYTVSKLTLNAADYGVPQRRRRVLLVGIRGDRQFEMITPSNFRASIDFPEHRVTALEALGDLPLDPVPKGGEASSYVSEPENPFQRYVRENAGSTVSLHNVPTMSARDREYVRHIPPGGNYQSIPDRLDTPRIARIKQTGGRTTTYGRLHPDAPAYTINTYFNRPNVGANYHYQAERLITVREALRLQSFPDSFTPKFSSQRSLHMQIGNAVPPLLARAVAYSLEEHFTAEESGS